MKRLLLAFSLMSVVFCILLYFGMSRFWQDFKSPGLLSHKKLLTIPNGAGLNQISQLLSQSSIIKDSFVFYWGVRLSQKGSSLKAGEYEFEAGITPESVMSRLVSGKVYQHKFTAAEGLTTAQIVEHLSSLTALEGQIQKLPEEGTLLPETYYFSQGDLRQKIIKRMETAQKIFMDRLWRTRPLDSPFQTKTEALILASIVEKETGLPQERPLIAAVFINRLKKGMALQSDPTISYILHKEQGRTLNEGLTKNDLKYSSPFNTYQNRGLPPHPICNPGQASLEAVFKPAPSKALYFVADGTGGHVFSTTLKEHQKNHAKWRKIRQNLKKTEAP